MYSADMFPSLVYKKPWTAPYMMLKNPFVTNSIKTWLLCSCALHQVRIPSLKTILASRIEGICCLYNPTSNNYDITASIIDYLEHHLSQLLKIDWLPSRLSSNRVETKPTFSLLSLCISTRQNSMKRHQLEKERGLVTRNSTYRIWSVILLAEVITTFHHLDSRGCLNECRIDWCPWPWCWIYWDETNDKIWMLFSNFYCCSCVVSCGKVTSWTHFRKQQKTPTTR